MTSPSLLSIVCIALVTIACLFVGGSEGASCLIRIEVFNGAGCTDLGSCEVRNFTAGVTCYYISSIDASLTTTDCSAMQLYPTSTTCQGAAVGLSNGSCFGPVIATLGASCGGASSGGSTTTTTATTTTTTTSSSPSTTTGSSTNAPKTSSDASILNGWPKYFL